MNLSIELSSNHQEQLLTNVNDQIRSSNIHSIFVHPRISLDYHLHMSLNNIDDWDYNRHHEHTEDEHYQ